MEFTLACKGNVYPCEVTIDEDNGRYMVRNADSSGEVFNTPDDLVLWVLAHWRVEHFKNERQFKDMIKEMVSYI